MGSRRLRIGVGAAIALVVAAFVVAVVVGLFSQGGGEMALARLSPALPLTPGTSGVPGGEETGSGEDVFVHVTGAVATPGLVTLAAGARVVDAIASAGGLTAEADSGGVNLARLVSDGEQLVVPREGEVQHDGSGVGAGDTAATGGLSGLVNVNTAGHTELETLPRIGPALAQRILDWRSANGRFAQITDLLKVAGIGDKVFEGLKERVTV